MLVGQEKRLLEAKIYVFLLFIICRMKRLNEQIIRIPRMLKKMVFNDRMDRKRTKGITGFSPLISWA